MREVTMSFTSKGDTSVGDMPYTVAVVKAEFEDVDEMLYALGKFKDAAQAVCGYRCSVVVENGFKFPSIYDEIKDLYEV